MPSPVWTERIDGLPRPAIRGGRRGLLGSHSAQFNAEVDRLHTKMRQTGRAATDASRPISGLAADGFGAVRLISFQAENALERFIETTRRT
jgi:hypothetical protein